MKQKILLVLNFASDNLMVIKGKALLIFGFLSAVLIVTGILFISFGLLFMPILRGFSFDWILFNFKLEYIAAGLIMLILGSIIALAVILKLPENGGTERR